ncbi:MAG: hypothetical protein ABFS46_19445 [Myxococcota bacterium]
MDEKTWAIAILILLLMGLLERYAPRRKSGRSWEDRPITARIARTIRRVRPLRRTEASADPPGSSDKRKRNPGNVWEREQKQHHPMEQGSD